MVDYYNMTGFQNQTNYPDIIIGINNASNGLFGIFLLFISALIVMIMLRNYPFSIQVLSGCGLALMEAIVMYATGVVTDSAVPLACLALVVLATIWVIWT